MKKDLKVVFFGDSVTEGCFEIGAPVDYANVYHARLERMWKQKYGENSISIINSGVGGDNTAMGIARIESAILAHKPDITVVCFGLNDSPRGMEKIDDFANNLKTIFDRTKTVCQTIIFMTPNMFNTYFDDATMEQYIDFAKETACLQNDGVMDSYMEKARVVCAENGVTVCDCYNEWKKLETYGIDTTRLLSNQINHPTRAMHQLFADSLMPVIEIKLLSENGI